MNQHESYKGFTLVELSIVIVIIGLIVAGVVGGQTLVEQAKIRSIVSDMNKFSVATNAFKLEYNSLPGDMENAVQFFDAGACPNFAGSGYTCNCNGNGNKRIGPQSVSPEVHERMRFWQHLNLADILEGNYDGACDYRHGAGEAIGRIMPAGPFPGTAYTIMDRDTTNGTDIHLGKRHASAGGQVTIYSAGFMTAAKVQNLDNKMDDGIADTGSLRGYDSPTNGTPVGTGNCVDGSNQYILSSTDEDCIISYEILR